MHLRTYPSADCPVLARLFKEQQVERHGVLLTHFVMER